MSPSPLERAQDWLARHGRRAIVAPHGDPDGLAAAALLAPHASGDVVHLETPWAGELPAERPIVLADWGVRNLESNHDLLYVDHHAEPERVEGTVLHADSTGDKTTSALAWRLVGEPPGRAWLAALGVIGDLGTGALGSAGLPRVPGKQGLRRLTTLVSAAGRLRGGPLPEAYDVLAGSGGPDEALSRAEVKTLDVARLEVEAHRRAALRIAPRVGPLAALIELDVPARVHSQVAATWMRRLAPRIVVVANRGWRTDRVSFSVRSAKPIDLRRWLREIYAPPDGAGDYARGHCRATGGSLRPDAFEQFARYVLDASPARGSDAGSTASRDTPEGAGGTAVRAWTNS